MERGKLGSENEVCYQAHTHFHNAKKIKTGGMATKSDTHTSPPPVYVAVTCSPEGAYARGGGHPKCLPPWSHPDPPGTPQPWMAAGHRKGTCQPPRAGLGHHFGCLFGGVALGSDRLSPRGATPGPFESRACSTATVAFLVAILMGFWKL